MATSGSVTVVVTRHDDLVFKWRLTSQSIANNTSTVAWSMQLVTDRYGRIDSTKSKKWSVTVNGTTYSGTNKIGIGNNSTLSLASGSTVIAHNTDGTKTFIFGFSQEFAIDFSESYIDTKSGEGSGTLTTIPRSSSLTVSNGTLNTAQVLNITAANASFKHKITYSCGSASGYAAGSASEYASSLSPSWTPPLSLASQNTTGTSVSVTLKLITYANDGTQIGTASKVIACAIPASVAPSCAVAVSDAMGYVDKYGGYVQGYSKFKVSITATIAYGAAIAAYSTTADKSTYTTASFTTGVLKSPGDLAVTATVKDTRGRVGTNKADVSVFAYAIPVVSKLSVRRCNSDGTANDQGEYTQLTFSGAVTSLNSKNSATYVLKYKKKTDTAYESVVLEDYTGVYSVLDGTYIFATDSSYTYDIQLAITDDFSTSIKATTVSTGFTIMSFLASGLGMALGKVAELANYLDVAFKTRFRDNIALDNDKNIYGYGADGELHSALIPWDANGNTALGYGGYANSTGQTLLYGADVKIVVKNANSTSYAPYYRKGDSITLEHVATAGYITDRSQKLYFTVPLSKPVIGRPTITAASVDGFILRQNNNYTHGSSPDTFVTPTSYAATIMEAGIFIEAVFSTTTNAISNAPIGVRWSGKITFS